LHESYRPGVFGAETVDEPALSLAERRGLAILHLAGEAAALTPAAHEVLGLAPPTTPNTTAAGEGAWVHWLAPDRWLAVSERSGPAALEKALGEHLDGTSAVNDVSQGRTVLRIRGWPARDLLAKGCPLDLDGRVFPTDACAQSTLAHINVLVCAVDADEPCFDVFVARGFALTLWEFLADGAGEIGYRVAPMDKAGVG
jgi:sarcosine oxidase subunit gamma